MNKQVILLLFTFFFTSLAFYAQSEKFGSVTKEDLKEPFYAPDSAASAVVLFKKRNSYYEYDNTVGWSVVTVVHERIKLFNQDGFDYASKKVPLYIGKTDELFTIKGYTYNLENNKIEKTKLSRSDVFMEEITDSWGSRNFTMPNLKEGSIVEWKYTVISPYTRSIDDLICQYDIPIKKLSAKIQIPEYYEFNAFPNPYNPVNLKREKVHKNYVITQMNRSEINSGFDNTRTTYSKRDVKLDENVFKVEQHDIPALKEEPYVNNIDNYRAKVSFEIAAYRPSNGVAEYYNTSWKDVTKTILESPNFGGQLDRSKFFEDDLNLISEKYTANNERILAIFEFIKNKVTWDESNGKYTRDGGIKKAYKEGSGNVAEVNLCLVAMLRAAGINANPVLVSTRSHGIPIFPTKKGFNYVIAAVESNGKITLLDATEKYSSPNILPLRDLNWEGRLIRNDGSSKTISLYPKSYNVKAVNLSAKLNSEGSINGIMITNYNGLNALNYRNRFAEQKEEELISKLESTNQNIEIDQFKLRNKEVIGKPLTEMVQFTQDNAVDIIGDKIYVSPLLFLTENENPFKQEERSYPIDYGSPWKNETKISLELPEGYIVASKPDDLSLALPEGMGSYLLKTELKENKIFITSQTKLNVPLIGPNYYETVKELYKRAIENQLEKIVLIQQGP